MKLLGVLALSYGVAPSTAFPSFRMRIPNGKMVPCPPGGIACVAGNLEWGQPESYCPGVGHAACQGGGPIGLFGEAFRDAGFRWSSEFCNADTDGDGFTNGEEMGDPCCLWDQFDGSGDYLKSWTPTHPGYASAFPENYVRPNCTAPAAELLPAAKFPTTSVYNEGEIQKNFTFRIKNFSVPNVRTTYMDFAFNFDDDEYDIYHIVKADALVELPKHLHHFVLTGCSKRIDEDMEGMPLVDGIPSYCNEQVGGFNGWAPGGRIYDVPNTAGIPFGHGLGIVGFALNVHYTDGHIHKDAVSTDGVTIHYTPTLRSRTVVNTPVVNIVQSDTMVVPSNSKRFFVTRTCVVGDPCADVDGEQMKEISALTCPFIAALGMCKDVFLLACPKSCNVCEEGGFEGVDIIASNYHAHILGTEMYHTVTRKSSNAREDMGSEPMWFYDDQPTFYFNEDSHVTLYPGDQVQSTCVYNSEGIDFDTRFDLETIDEMCLNNVVSIHSTGELSSFRAFSCVGNAWTGELAEGEDATKIPENHPQPQQGEVYEHNDLVGLGNRIELSDGLTDDDDEEEEQQDSGAPAHAAPCALAGALLLAACL